eukprot:TRINITY_DN2577_c0_g2_i2.p1 TRINITY_DN2577_c0_g2~~TRINITY_DN2577_c0_g2_i2.p1  ORF type:complete len:109 (-),score=46.16 TRINITY_DN2577_c0_g2_i2:416-742(-)
MIRRPPRSTQSRSSAASDVYKRQVSTQSTWGSLMNNAEIFARLKPVDFEKLVDFTILTYLNDYDDVFLTKLTDHLNFGLLELGELKKVVKSIAADSISRGEVAKVKAD